MNNISKQLLDELEQWTKPLRLEIIATASQTLFFSEVAVYKMVYIHDKSLIGAENLTKPNIKAYVDAKT